MAPADERHGAQDVLEALGDEIERTKRAQLLQAQRRRIAVLHLAQRARPAPVRRRRRGRRLRQPLRLQLGERRGRVVGRGHVGDEQAERLGRAEVAIAAFLGADAGALGGAELVVAAGDQPVREADQGLVDEFIGLEERAHDRVEVVQDLRVRQIGGGLFA